MPGYKNRSFGHHVICNTNRLFGIAGIVTNFELKLFTQHAPCRVDIGNSFLRAVHELLAENSLTARDWPCDTDDDRIGGGFVFFLVAGSKAQR